MIHTLLEPLYQPIVDRDGEVFAYEALLRFRGGAAISPADMVKRWERTGFIVKADFAMLRRVAEQLETKEAKLRIAVNVSIATIEAACSEYIQALIALAPYTRRLIVELTETAAVTNTSALRSFFQACNDHRFIVALDDCHPGHPYGTMSFINNFRPNLIKIDGEYLLQCYHDGNSDELRNLIEGAHRHDARVIAEYVESSELLEFAFNLGVDYVQGFVLGRPAPIHPAQVKRPQDWTAEEQLLALQDSHGLSGNTLHAWCRDRGIFTKHLASWKLAFCVGGSSAATGGRELLGLKEDNASLRRDVLRKDKALAEAAALLILPKKFQALCSGEDKWARSCGVNA